MQPALLNEVKVPIPNRESSISGPWTSRHAPTLALVFGNFVEVQTPPMRLGDRQVTTVGLSGGGSVSPDHTMVLFEHQAPRGRITYYLWRHETRAVQPLISIWVCDPDSGRAWGEAWSPDSKVIRFKGRSLGYGPRRGEGSEFDLLYVLSENTFYSVPIVQ